LPKTLGKHRDTLPILLRAGAKESGDGFVYEGFLVESFKVAVVNDSQIREAAGVDPKAFARAIAAIQLRDAHEAKDHFAANNATARLLQTSTPDEYDRELSQLKKQVPPEMFAKLKAAVPTIESWPQRTWAHYYENAHRNVAGEFTAAMREARLVLWLRMEHGVIDRRAKKVRWKAERIEPGILVPDILTALYVRAALRDLRACPCCNSAFMPARPDQYYCSLRCRETHRQRRRRSKTAKKP
jgi:hypothetical protein